MDENMSKSHNLSNEEQAELEDWLYTKRITLNHRTRRNLSDVVNMALLFKKVGVKLVNMKNYTSHGSLALKIINWETFNLKVLRKTGLLLMRPSLEQLALGNLNAIRWLLYHLMRIERSVPDSSTMSLKQQADDTHCQRETPTQNQAEQAYVKMISEDFEELKRDKYICALLQKIIYLESVIESKEERINQLLLHLSTLSVRIISMQTTLPVDEPTPQE